VGGNAQIKPLRKVAGRLKLELSQYRDLEAFSQFGSDLDADTQATLARGERLVRTLNQKERSPMAVEDQVAVIFAATNGFLDRISVDRVPEFHEQLIARLHSADADLLKQIASGEWTDDVEEELREAVAAFADDFGYDLDEDGEPTDDGDSEEAAPPADASSNGSSRSDADDEDEDETADEPEKEAAPA
jgi:F-type H+/Na+-transporting ATPase subunit alpha